MILLFVNQSDFSEKVSAGPIKPDVRNAPDGKWQLSELK